MSSIHTNISQLKSLNSK